MKILTIGTHGPPPPPPPKSVRGKKLKYKTMVKYEPFYCRKKGCCYSSW